MVFTEALRGTQKGYNIRHTKHGTADHLGTITCCGFQNTSEFQNAIY
jgi:hypothetical protein